MSPAMRSPRILVTRAPGQSDQLIAALRDAGLTPVAVPTIDVELAPGGGDFDDALRAIGWYDWVVVTSANGAHAVLRAAERVLIPFEATRWAVIGKSTRQIFEREGVDVAFQPSTGSAEALAIELPITVGDRVLLVRGNLAGDRMPDALRARGAVVEDVLGYTTIEAPASSAGLLGQAYRDGQLELVVFTSGSTIRGLIGLADLESIDVLGLPAVCIGPETAAEARRAGFDVVAVSTSPDVRTLAADTAAAVRHSGTGREPVPTGRPAGSAK